MRLVSGVLSLSSSFWMFLLLDILQTSENASYKPLFYLFPIVLLCISIACFYQHIMHGEKNK